MIKKSLFGAVALAAFCGSALAADLPTRKEAPVYVPVAPVFTWTGFYFGVNAGAVFNKSKFTEFYQGTSTSNGIALGRRPAHASTSSDGFTGGAQVGYNWQSGMFVTGVEADINYIGGKKRSAWSDPAGRVSVFKTEPKWLGTARLRAGVAFDRFLVYATGGLAYGDVKNSVAWYDPNGALSWAGSKSTTRAGWTLGGGVEYAITNNLSVKGEYLYYNLGKKTFAINSVVGTTPNYGARVKTDGHIVRAGLNWKF